MYQFSGFGGPNCGGLELVEPLANAMTILVFVVLEAECSDLTGDHCG